MKNCPNFSMLARIYIYFNEIKKNWKKKTQKERRKKVNETNGAGAIEVLPCSNCRKIETAQSSSGESNGCHAANWHFSCWRRIQCRLMKNTILIRKCITINIPPSHTVPWQTNPSFHLHSHLNFQRVLVRGALETVMLPTATQYDHRKKRENLNKHTRVYKNSIVIKLNQHLFSCLEWKRIRFCQNLVARVFTSFRQFKALYILSHISKSTEWLQLEREFKSIWHNRI